MTFRAATVAVAVAVVVVVAVAVAVAVAFDSAFDLSPREGAARRQCLKRIKKRRLSERSEFRRFPFQVLATRAVRAADRSRRGRLFLVTSFGEAKEVTRLPGRSPAWS